MALFTPRGLKLRLPTAYAFALMARVFPQTDAFRVLQLTEEIENLGALASFIAGIMAFSLRLEPVQITLVVFVAVSAFRLVHLFGFFVPPLTLLLRVSRVYSRISGYGVLLVALLIFGFWATGWRGMVAFIVGRVACAVVFSLTELFYERQVYRKTGLFISASERSFSMPTALRLIDWVHPLTSPFRMQNLRAPIGRLCFKTWRSSGRA